MDDALGKAYLRDVLRGLRMYKELGEKAIAQVADDADLNRQLDAESNSIAIIAKHVGGNLRSRFTDFLTTDGEKPTRNRDTEFESPSVTRHQILKWWNEGFAVAIATVESLRPEDLTRTVTIRQEAFLVVEALNRAIMHIAYHVGQVVYVSRHFASADWKSLSIPRGQSAQAQIGTFKRH